MYLTLFSLNLLIIKLFRIFLYFFLLLENSAAKNVVIGIDKITAILR